jgi:hypothetical protein
VVVVEEAEADPLDVVVVDVVATSDMSTMATVPTTMKPRSRKRRRPSQMTPFQVLDEEEVVVGVLMVAEEDLLGVVVEEEVEEDVAEGEEGIRQRRIPAAAFRTVDPTVRCRLKRCKTKRNFCMWKKSISRFPCLSTPMHSEIKQRLDKPTPSLKPSMLRNSCDKRCPFQYHLDTWEEREVCR